MNLRVLPLFLAGFGWTQPMAFAADGAASEAVVCILKVIDHRALDETVRGIGDALVGKNIKIRIESAQGNPSLAAQIAQKFAGRRPNVLVAVGTVAAQGAARYASPTPGGLRILYSSVTDPLEAGLVGNPSIGGVSNYVPLEPQLELFCRIQPRLQKLGILYNPGEVNSIAIVKKLRKLSPTMGIALVEQVATKTSEIPQAATKLAGLVDAIFISNDNTALGALRSVVRAANGRKIPVYVSDTDAVSQGALAALGPNQYQVGLQTGRVVRQILEGKLAGNLPHESVESMDLFLNARVAQLLDIGLDEVLLGEAKEVLR